MHVFERSAAAGTTAGAVEVVRWEQFPAARGLPFGAMWYSVEAGRSSAPDRHADLELSLVLTGEAHVEVGGVVTVVPQGSGFLLDGDEEHVVHNPSGTEALQIFSAYWLPEGAAPADGPDA